MSLCKNVIKQILGIGIAGVLLSAGRGAAQEQALDPNANPEYGIAAGAVGFRPDPFRVQAMFGGGEINANTRNLSDDCFGQIGVAPNFRFTALSDFEALRFLFIADAVTADASLIIRDPAGDYHCNNDSSGVRHPMVTFAPAAQGDYNVWVGSLSDRVFGDLYLTTQLEITAGSTGLVIPRATPTAPMTPTPTTIPANALNYTLPATYGSETLTAGFLPDPYWSAVIGGGGLNVEGLPLGEACAGYTSAAPTFTLNWAGISTRLRFLFAEIDPTQDAALIVRAPDGGWQCNRDFAGGYTRPQVEFINPPEGTYHVWVSSEDTSDVGVMGVVYATEKMFSPETVVAAGTQATTPIDGLVAQASAFVFDSAARDPYAIPGSLGGGGLDIGEQNPDCPGAYTVLPSFGFVLPDPTLHLRVFFAQDDPRADAALIVRMPDGTWYCNDDSFNGKQPTVDVIGNFSTGEVSVWVGSFAPEESIPGTLYLTRGSANPIDPTRSAPVIGRE
ncbi:MAG: hypothetical protein ABI835_04870 [Chloroflexota bacterium]